MKVTNFDHCFHIVMVIGKCKDAFRGDFFVLRGGGGGGNTWEDLSMEEFIMRDENFRKEDAGFSSIIKKNNEKINKNKIFSWK